MGRQPLDLSLYLITDTVLCGELGVCATVAGAVEGGATVVQLRDPSCSDDDFVTLGRRVMRELAGSGVPLIVNDRVELAAAIGADGAHVGQDDVDVAWARELLGPEGHLGLSVQTVAHVEQARRAAGLIDYLGVGPVWPQGTKPDAAPAIGPDTLAAITGISPWPCVAIGGITVEHVLAVRRHGVHGVAVVSAVCGQPDPAAAARGLRAAWDQAGEQL